MLNKENILGFIADHQEEIDELEKELTGITNENVINAVQQRLSYLRDNKYHYELQARAWKLID
ncbi:hypothetical protein [Candidatus Enterococcus clewellii]|uniref:Uncharacterized protein n=1 Tax=Candidatus Enterococcus clewellii TaxID=1834193 RepID=A0A242K919_9ENTE|nr:hypothetical protein [Enterococcus sp. 9E7_DIV0242]OTP17278.1 hypothetical protein A5888_001416 [Enterococcus sp. 9E7_DIV0242]